MALWIAALSSHVHLEQDRPLGVTIFCTVHFTTELRSANADLPWLIHELTHVWQYCQRGPRYLVDALQAQSKHGADAYDIQEGLAKGWAWETFNLEQQSEIASALYRALTEDRDVSI